MKNNTFLNIKTGLLVVSVLVAVGFILFPVTTYAVTTGSILMNYDVNGGHDPDCAGLPTNGACIPWGDGKGSGDNPAPGQFNFCLDSAVKYASGLSDISGLQISYVEVAKQPARCLSVPPDSDESNGTYKTYNVSFTSNLNVSCHASPNSAQTNQIVNFISSVSGGTGNYNYSWSGACTGSGSNCNMSFLNPGTYTATITVSSGNQTRSANCSVNIISIPPPQASGNLSCNSSTGNSITLNYSFSNGSNVSLFRENTLLQTFNNSSRSSNYTDTGLVSGTSYTYYLRNGVLIYSLLLDSTTCSTQTATPFLNVSCYTSPNPAQTNQTVSFISSVSGGTGNHSYSWSGACTGSSSNCNICFINSGTYTATVTVTSGNQTRSASCSVNIAEIPPSQPNGNLSSNSSTENSITLNYSFSNGSNVSLFRGDTLLKTFSTSSGSGTYTDTGLSSGNSYTYYLRNGTSTSSSLIDSTTYSTQSSTSSLNVSCYTSPNSAQTNQTVNFISSVSGGTGNYSYSWSGACIGWGSDCNVSFINSGTYTATLTVTSGNQTRSASCSVSVNNQNNYISHSYKQCYDNNVYWYDSYGSRQEIYQDCSAYGQICQGNQCYYSSNNNLNVSCYTSPNSAQTNQTVNFISSVSGGTGNYSYSWSGACIGWGSDCNVSFINSGTYTATLTVTSGNQTRSASCQANVSTISNQCICNNWGNWQNQGCGQGGCSFNQIYQTKGRICSPRLCAQEIESTCTYSSICVQQPITIASYTKYFRKSCSNNTLYWFDSNGLRQDKYQDCSDDNECTLDKCQNNVCVNELKCDGTTCKTDSEDYVNACKTGETSCPTGEGGLIISLLGEREGDSLGWSKNINITPGGGINFLFVVTNNGQDKIDNVIVRGEIPGEITISGLSIDGNSSTSDIKTGINLGSVSSKEVKTITFKGKIGSNNIQEGEKEIIIRVNSGDLSDSDSLKINITKSQGVAVVGLAATKFFFGQWYFWLLLILAVIFLFYIIFRNLFSVLP